MVAFYGDYDTTETVYMPFNTFTSDDPSASVTITNLASTDVHIHKDGSTTQRSSANGVTVSVDFDTITGNHLVAIDLSDNSDAGYYANGSTYQVRMEGTTVDGATINAWIGAFSIGRMLRPTTAGRTLDVESGGCAGIDWANVANPTTAVDLSGTDIQLVDTCTANTDMVTEPPTVAQIQAEMEENGDSLLDTIADKLPTNYIMGSDDQDDHNTELEDWADGGRLDLLLDELTTQGDTNEGKIDTAQADLDIITGAAGVVIADGALTAAKFGADCITNAKIADDAIAAENLATGAIAADAVASTALDNVVMADLAAVPAATASIVDAINWIFEICRNRTVTNGTNDEIELYKDDAGTKFAEADISDDGTDFERGEWGAVD